MVCIYLVIVQLAELLRTATREMPAAASSTTATTYGAIAAPVEAVSFFLAVPSPVAAAGTAAEAMTPGIIGMGTSKLASATGSIVDGRVEATKMIRVRVKLKDTNELVEVQQEVTPNFTLKIGQEVVITQGSTPGNVWPD